jgi:hypothetical protein
MVPAAWIPPGCWRRRRPPMKRKVAAVVVAEEEAVAEGAAAVEEAEVEEATPNSMCLIARPLKRHPRIAKSSTAGRDFSPGRRHCRALGQKRQNQFMQGIRILSICLRHFVDLIGLARL